MVVVLGRSYGDCELCDQNNDKEEVMEGTTKMATPLVHKQPADHAFKLRRSISWDFKNEWIWNFGLMIKVFI